MSDLIDNSSKYLSSLTQKVKTRQTIEGLPLEYASLKKLDTQNPLAKEKKKEIQSKLQREEKINRMLRRRKQ